MFGVTPVIYRLDWIGSGKMDPCPTLIYYTADLDRRYKDVYISAMGTTLVVPPVQRSTLGDRAFPVAAPRAWNSLPPSLRTVSSLVQFRHQLKTFLFVHSFE